MNSHDSNRILVRIKFIKDNQTLCKKAFSFRDITHKHWKREHGRKLVNKARTKIGYSKSTISCDIFWSIKGLYQWMKTNKII